MNNLKMNQVEWYHGRKIFITLTTHILQVQVDSKVCDGPGWDALTDCMSP